MNKELGFLHGDPRSGRKESIYQPYIDSEKEIREINAEYSAPFVKG